ncbi:MAG: hypothetical protein ACTSPI_13880 [Candidatus Heimdallarchaeaceae archaeon]
MTEENTEETNANPVEEETTVEQPQTEPVETPQETPPVETETPKEKTDSPKREYSDNEKRLYARAKKAEEEAKKAKEELAKKTEDTKPKSDVDAIIEVQRATDGLDPTEIAELKNRSTILGVSLSEARKDENFVLWQNAYRAKVEKEKALNPSTRQEVTEKPKTFIDKLGEADKHSNWRTRISEKEKLLTEKGLWKNPRIRKDSERNPLSQ